MILDQILRQKRKEVKKLKSGRRFTVLMTKAVSLPAKSGFFVASLSKKRPFINVIAEIKKKSPSKGVLRRAFDPVWIARQYEKAGASALSVLTDRLFFAGSPAIFKKVRLATRLPLLRKEFIVDAAQIYESKELGADAILLIAKILTYSQLKEFSRLANQLGLDILYEIHDEADWAKIKPLHPKVVGINNRNLETFKVDLDTTQRLARKIGHKGLMVAESGIASFYDIVRLKKFGAKAVPVGESLMRQKNPGLALRTLLKKPRA